MTPNLAIVVPAYKPEYLEQTLASIRDQTDHRFTLYIFDDASPYQIEDLVHPDSFDCRVYFKRFAHNLGRDSLTRQWDRCIRHTGGEDWIWLFSDDDTMTDDCVASFYQELERNPGFSAYRFNTEKVTANGEVIRVNQFPKMMNGSDFLNLKLSYQQESYIVEYIFSRKAYNRVKGFPELPLAWTADDLFCLNLAEDGGICSIERGVVQWRYSDLNISGRQDRKQAKKKIAASATFVKRILDRPDVVHNLNPKDLPISWYVRQIRSMLDQLTFKDQLKAVGFIAGQDKNVWNKFFRMKMNRSKLIGWLKKFSS